MAHIIHIHRTTLGAEFEKFEARARLNVCLYDSRSSWRLADHSLALLADAGHMLTDAAALNLNIGGDLVCSASRHIEKDLRLLSL